ncbi:cytochrome c oxidase assembly protein COX18, mitochondrial isoform X1 [Anguilla anguilla]|uniref:cytochrome c oxidase assembly protein COX18, mitochondrial isoform X1 n=2 Tax=Anguilla anguilla TaxID=7936 RepID=UPI0015B2FC4C|nr:cytochrome c oxidase assembly protein COX18, mitochondrial isoform X1 [Anguilla anguilla]
MRCRMMRQNMARLVAATCRHACQGNRQILQPRVLSIAHAAFSSEPSVPLKPASVALLSRLRCPTHPGSLAPRRALSSNRPGWYESMADSTPVHLTEQLLVTMQQTTGLPWWASIIGTTLALRTVITLPLGAYQMVIIGKVEALQAEIAELAKRLRYEVSVRGKQLDWSEKVCRYQFKKNLRRIVSELYVRDNCHPFKASLLVWVQLPMWVCLSLALRNLSLGTADSTQALQGELAVGGALWFPDLTLPDSTWVMPVCLGLANLLSVEIFALRRLEASKLQKYVTNFIRGISLVMIPLAATVPSSMALYWLSSSCVGLFHNLLLRSPRFRRLCRIPPTRSDSDTPYRDIATAFVAKYLK